jgi:hypothetical protein
VARSYEVTPSYSQFIIAHSPNQSFGEPQLPSEAIIESVVSSACYPGTRQWSFSRGPGGQDYQSHKLGSLSGIREMEALLWLQQPRHAKLQPRHVTWSRDLSRSNLALF